jgi:DNA-binding transcriptional LysR family regulator
MSETLLQQGGLSLDRLQSFCLVAKAGGVTKAAKGDPARQSLFSRQIKELEEFFGVELVRRNGRGVALTAAGLRLHALAREQLAGLLDFKQECAGISQELTLAAGDSVIQWVLLPKLVELQSKLPAVRLRVLNLPSAEIASGLAEGTIDLGIVRKGAAGKIQCAPLGKMEFSLFAPRGLLAGTEANEPTLARIAQLPLATLEGTGEFRSELARIARRKKVEFNIALELSSFPLLAKAVQGGACAAILPGLARGEFDAGKVVELQPDWLSPLRREMALAWNPRLSRIRAVVNKAIPVFRNACGIE